MIRPRNAVAALLFLPALLGAAWVMGETRTRQYWITSNGVTYGGTQVVSNDNGNETKAVICKVTCGAIDCSVCHTSGRDRTKESYTVANHNKIYYPKFAVVPKEGYRLSWGSYGGHVIYKNGQYAYLLKDGKLNMTAPAGTLFLRDRSGVPFMFLLPSDPTIRK